MIDRHAESMVRWPTVLLVHRRCGDRHHDWLLADPAVPEGPLWAGRVRPASHQWASLRGWYVQQIAAHRRRYLTYEGPLSGGRGTVRRVDEGTFAVRCWQPDRILIELALRHCRALVLLRRVRDRRWWAKVVPEESVAAVRPIVDYD